MPTTSNGVCGVIAVAVPTHAGMVKLFKRIAHPDGEATQHRARCTWRPRHPASCCAGKASVIVEILKRAGLR